MKNGSLILMIGTCVFIFFLIALLAIEGPGYPFASQANQAQDAKIDVCKLYEEVCSDGFMPGDGKKMQKRIDDIETGFIMSELVVQDFPNSGPTIDDLKKLRHIKNFYNLRFGIKSYPRVFRVTKAYLEK